MRWKNAVSEPLYATNGVKHGSVLSPIILTLCLDDLIVELEDNGDGCRIGMKYFGIVGFADDLKRLSPSLLGMLNICKAFSTSTGLTFKAKKSLCIKFHHRHHVNEITQYTIFLGNEKLKWYSQVKHIDHTFNCCINCSADVACRKGQFIGCVNGIITQFGFGHTVCKQILFVTHGYTFYGSSLWDLYDNDSKM